MIQYRKYPIRGERYYGLLFIWNPDQPTIDIYLGKHVHVFFVRRRK